MLIETLKNGVLTRERLIRALNDISYNVQLRGVIRELDRLLEMDNKAIDREYENYVNKCKQQESLKVHAIARNMDRICGMDEPNGEVDMDL